MFFFVTISVCKGTAQRSGWGAVHVTTLSLCFLFSPFCLFTELHCFGVWMSIGIGPDEAVVVLPLLLQLCRCHVSSCVYLERR